MRREAWRFLSPELVLGRPGSPASDVFALGAMLYEAMTGHPAFEGKTDLDMLVAVRYARFTPVRDVSPDAPAGLAAIVERCLALDPVARFPDPAAVADALDAWLSETGLAPEESEIAELVRGLLADAGRP